MVVSYLEVVVDCEDVHAEALHQKMFLLLGEGRKLLLGEAEAGEAVFVSDQKEEEDRFVMGRLIRVGAIGEIEGHFEVFVGARQERQLDILPNPLDPIL